MQWFYSFLIVALLGSGVLLWAGCPSQDDDAGDDDAGDDDSGDDDSGDDDAGDDDAGDDDAGDDADGDGHGADWDCDDNDASITPVWVNLTADPGGDGSLEEPYTTIAEGIAAGTGCVLVIGGIYSESLTVSGQVEIRGLTDASATRIDGGGEYPIFIVESGGALTLRSIHLNNGAADEGACIRVEGGSVALDQMIVDECDSKEDGGAIWGFQSSITLTGTQVINCASAFGDGGGLYLDECTLVIDDCLFKNLDADDGYGGAMELVETDTIVTRTHFLDADAEAGGAIDVFGGGSFSATGVLFEYNRAWIEYDVMGEGGAIASSGASVQVVNCTFSDNQGELGAGIYFQTADPSDTLEIRNSIFHLQGGGALRLDGLIDDPVDAAIEYNDFFGNTTLVNGQVDTAAFAASNLFVDPDFLGYAGPYPEVNNFHLHGDSPLLDAGDPDDTFDDLDGTRAEMGCYGGPTPLP